MSTLTHEQELKIAEFLESHTLAVGLGTKASACSIAAINIALTGELTDNIPDCMSEVIGQFIISVQDKIPDEIRNSPEWKLLLPLAAGTGREKEWKRFEILADFVWGLLNRYQPIADKKGFGEEWKRLMSERPFGIYKKVDAIFWEIELEDDKEEEDTNWLYIAACRIDEYLNPEEHKYRKAFSLVDAIAAFANTDVDPDLAWIALDPCGLLRKLIEA